jgi:hypothetical protein
MLNNYQLIELTPLLKPNVWGYFQGMSRLKLNEIVKNDIINRKEYLNIIYYFLEHNIVWGIKEIIMHLNKDEVHLLRNELETKKYLQEVIDMIF